MKRFLTSLLFLFALSSAIGQPLYFPPLLGQTWDTISLSQLGWCTDKTDTLYNYLEEKNTEAFIVLKDGKIVIEKYFDSFTKDSTWYWASAGKSLVAALVGIAQQDQLLSLSDTTSIYLGQGWTSCTATQEAQIKLVHQLSMTTGLDDGQNVDCTSPSCLTYLAPPGTRWAYHNAPYTLLQEVVEQASGLSINALVAQKLTPKTGISGLFLPLGDLSIFVSKPRNMARFGLLMLNHGYWGNTGVLTDSIYFQQMISPSQNINPAYGYLWWLNGQTSYMLPGLQLSLPGSIMPSAPADLFAAMGKNGQLINVVPSQNLVVVRVGNSPDNSFVPNYFNDTIWQKLNAVMCQTTGFPEENADLNFSVYPNPANQTIKMVAPTSGTLLLYNAQGQLAATREVNAGPQTLQLHAFSGGFYTLVFQSYSGQTIAIKLAINHSK